MKINPILSDPNDSFKINSNPTFKFLRSEAEKLKKDSSLSPSLKKSTMNNLTLLLNEAILTPNPKQQNEILEKVNTWYRAHTPKLPENFKFFTPKLENSSKAFAKTPQPRDLFSKNAASSFTSTPDLPPKKYIYYLNKNYLKTFKSLNPKYSIHELSRSKPSQDSPLIKRPQKFLKMTPKKIKPFKRPSTKLPIIDLRDTESRQLDSSQRFRAEHIAIEDVKRRLANKRLFVSSRCLENGISLYTEKTNFNNSQILPNGGELLMKRGEVKTAVVGKRGSPNQIN